MRRAEPGLPGRVVIIGAGTMGARIALFLAQHGLAVCATSRRAETLRAAAAAIRSVLADPVPDRGPAAAASPAAESPDDILGRIRLCTDAGDELGRADLVVETIREDLAAKVALLGQIGPRVRPDAIVTTNTSSLDLASLAEALPGPERFAGLHWFNPADLIELVEVVPAPGTASSVVETLRTWLAALGKTPVVLRHGVPGFVANRLQYALLREAHALVAAGVCSWADADLAVARGLGPRWAAVGPFQSMDMAGLDVHLAVAGALFPGLAADTAPPQALARLVEAGHLGTKSGRGLLGEYPAERREALTRQRDVTLRLMPAVRAAAASQAGPGPTEPPAEGPRQ
ncbi:MAG TPA: 3-hydroxyacyl-CoA dehydrogenase NAD-binding domain-containing protein [Streptosporangiaceae bacterium]|nr:3-hydroxyacyl-CoA dehydrogenase NAD-binding domain-containing protein [Streptosporangiaceae bacterium]